MHQDKTFPGPDGDFHYIDWQGTGPVTHIAHATGFCARIYAPLAERLTTDLHVLGMDDRGHGRTTAAADPARLKAWDTFADDQERFFERFNEPVIAMGHSRGAVASLILAIRRPDLIRALILIDPTILPRSWKWPWFMAKKLGLTWIAPIVSTAANRRNSWSSKDELLNLYRNKYPFKSWTEGFLEGYIQDGTRKTDNGTIRLSCNPKWESKCFSTCPHDMYSQISKLSMPTMVLYGANSDTFIAPTKKRLEAILPTMVFKRFDKTSHFVPMERPDETAAAILAFLRENGIV